MNQLDDRQRESAAAGGARRGRAAAPSVSRPREVRLALVVTAPERLPRDGRPQVAFMGRSNVGKSSLLNRLIGRRSLARVSKTPGRTREIHFYSIDDRLYFVDLPGFGFAKVSQAQRRAWGRLVEAYVDSASALVLAVQLVDSRHEPTPLDLMLNEALAARRLPRVVVLTKGDKLSGSALPRAVSRTRRALDLGPEEPLIVTSATTGRGVRELSALISATVSASSGDGEEQP